MKSSSATIQMEATKQYFPVVLFALCLELLRSADQILKCDYSNDNYSAVCSRVRSFETILAFLLQLLKLHSNCEDLSII